MAQLLCLQLHSTPSSSSSASSSFPSVISGPTLPSARLFFVAAVLWRCAGRRRSTGRADFVFGGFFWVFFCRRLGVADGRRRRAEQADTTTTTTDERWTASVANER